MKNNVIRVLKEFIWYFLWLLLFLFVPLKMIRAIALSAILYRVAATVAAKYVPSKLKVSMIQKPYYATLHKPFTLEFEILNRGIFPLTLFLLEVKCQGLFFLSPRQYLLSLSGKSSKHFSIQVVGDNRGNFNWGPMILDGWDPLHLFNWNMTLDISRPIILYPTVQALDLRIERGLTGGSLNVHNRIYENVTSFQALRKYQPGDELKKINWKASARMGDLYSNIYDCSLYFPVQIVLNLSEDEYPLNNRHELSERAIAVSASLALNYLQLKQKVGLISSGQRLHEATPFRYIPQANGSDQSSIILEELAAIQFSKKGMSMNDLFNLPQNQGQRGMKYLVVTPPLGSEDQDFISQQQRSGKDLELYYVTGLKTRRNEISDPGVPFYIVDSQGGRPIREN